MFKNTVFVRSNNIPIDSNFSNACIIVDLQFDKPLLANGCGFDDIYLWTLGIY